MPPTIHIACTKKLNLGLKNAALQKGIDIQDAEIIETKSTIDDSILGYLTNKDYTFVFTSSKAVKYVQKYIETNNLTVANNCFGLSGATLQSLNEAKFNTINTADNAENLAEKIAETDHKLLVHFTAKDHRLELHSTLAKHNIGCKKCFVYTKTNTPKIFDAKDAALFFSPSQVDCFLLLNTIEPKTPVFAIGQTTANHLQTKGFSNIITSQKPTQEALMASIYQYFKK